MQTQALGLIFLLFKRDVKIYIQNSLWIAMLYFITTFVAKKKEKLRVVLKSRWRGASELLSIQTC